MAEESVLPEGSTEVGELREETRNTNSLLGRILNNLATLLVIVLSGVILKVFDFTSAKETEFNEKAHAFAETAINAQLRFANAANDQAVSARALGQAMIFGLEQRQVYQALNDYESKYSRYQLNARYLQRMAASGDAAHFFEKGALQELQNDLKAPLTAIGRHHACLENLARHYGDDKAEAGLQSPDGIYCTDHERVYYLEDELNLLDSCESHIGEQVYDLADQLTSDGWRKVEAVRFGALSFGVDPGPAQTIAPTAALAKRKEDCGNLRSTRTFSADEKPNLMIYQKNVGGGSATIAPPAVASAATGSATTP